MHPDTFFLIVCLGGTMVFLAQFPIWIGTGVWADSASYTYTTWTKAPYPCHVQEMTMTKGNCFYQIIYEDKHKEIVHATTPIVTWPFCDDYFKGEKTDCYIKPNHPKTAIPAQMRTDLESERKDSVKSSKVAVFVGIPICVVGLLIAVLSWLGLKREEKRRKMAASPAVTPTPSHTVFMTSTNTNSNSNNSNNNSNNNKNNNNNNNKGDDKSVTESASYMSDSNSSALSLSSGSTANMELRTIRTSESLGSKV